MGGNKLILFVHTVKYLKLKQIYYQLYYMVRNRFFKKENYAKLAHQEIQPLEWKDVFLYQDSFYGHKNFEFLNIQYQFTETIDWNYAEFGKLWTYNLNYFDFLNQEKITKEEGLGLIKNYLKNKVVLKDGKEPYPISLRGINWIKFLSKNKIFDSETNQVLYNHHQILFHGLEYHLLGNHLLENAYALFFGGYYFKDEALFLKAKQILKEELTEQIMKDGAHFELSPMYHQILLHRLLDCIQLSQLNSWKHNDLLPFLIERASKMLSWLQAITYNNGSVPMVNDSAHKIAPKSSQLFKYAKDLNLVWEKSELSDSGYRMFKKDDFQLFVDVGNVGPDYQPGHAHSDTFNFELYVKDNPVIVDTGISTYEKNEIRQNERETASHNTVKIKNQEQTQVWGGFKVANRAKIVSLVDGDNEVRATHDGYKNLGILHTRNFVIEPSCIIIEDFLDKEINQEQVAYFHFHPNVKNIEIKENKVKLLNENIKIQFNSILKIQLQNYEYAQGFNRTIKSQKIAVFFNKTLQTQIYL